ncbi:BAG domain-containing protein [Xylariomycetidae sp. FL2044]|nr:BAG domain-containing protein [Xylariomycetidae sp. FL2044]
MISYLDLIPDTTWAVGQVYKGYPVIVKVASSQAFLASSGALQNITSLLPPALLSYVDTTIGHLSDALTGSNEYLAAQGASPTLVYSTLAGAAAVAVPLVMSRYGWPSNRDNLSPFASQTDSRGVPHVTDDDFSYITSEDLENSLQSPARTYDAQSRQAPPNSAPEDDVLLIKNKGVTYPVHFPAYSIGDGKLLVEDVRIRAGMVMRLSDRRTQRTKLLYKGRQLKEQKAPVRDYGVKNNSELLTVVPEGTLTDGEDDSSSEEVVVTDEQKPKKKKNKRNKKRKGGRPESRDGGANLEVPGQQDGDSRRASPDPSRHPSRVPSPSVPSGPLEKIAAIRNHFETQLLPLCQAFMANPPRDAKKCEDEHRKLSETTMQHVLLKLDEVDTEGKPEIRAKRKELVNYVQDVLKQIDEYIPSKK